MAAGTGRAGRRRWLSKKEASMNIGAAANVSGLTAKMIRYYERIELVPASRRTRSGYRDYLERDVQVLRFIHHARELGFSLTQVRALLALWRDRQRPSRGARRIRKKSYAKVFRASVGAETSRLPVCGSAARRNRR
ncbi:MerR family transcriptional regulator [Pseudomonas aeruginosa]|uniref:MerR family transcriptional regulator n=1 Tax=Pseudomonas aeruginosa TaxID=287 RepID=UPI002AA2A513|nr:MerR family transcriptional regulator [Pseudomonas aeruginosa]